MNKIDQLQMLNLLESLEKETITTEQFQILLEYSSLSDRILKIIEMDEFHGKEKLITSIFQNPIQNTKIIEILETHPIYYNNEKVRKFLLDHIDSIYLDEFADLLEFEFLFNDQEFVNQMLEFSKDKTNKGFREIRKVYQKLYEKIKFELDFFKDGQKNPILEAIFSLQNLEDLESFINFSKVKTITNQKEWIKHLVSFYNNFFNNSIKSQLPNACITLQEQENMEQINQKFLEIEENRELSLGEKQQKIQNLLGNLITVTETTSEFQYLLKFLSCSSKIFDQQARYSSLFSDDTSLCKYGSKLYNQILSIPKDSIQDIVFQAMCTSLKDYIDETLLEEISTLSGSNAADLLTQIALDNQCLDYLENKIKDKKRYLSHSFCSYMKEHPNLTKEELLEIKKDIQNATIMFDGYQFILQTTIERNAYVKKQ